MSLTLSLLSDINTQINSTVDLDDLLRVIMDSAKRLCDADGSSLLLIDEETGNLTFNVATGERADEVEKQTVPVGEGFAGHVAQTGESLICNDVQSDPRHYKEIDRMVSNQTRNIIVVPMKVKDTLVGILEVINSLDREEFSSRDMRLLTYLADQAAIAINNRELMTSLEDRLRELSCLYEITQHISYIHDEDELFKTALDKISEVMYVNRASFLFRDSNEDKLRIRAAIGIDCSRVQDILVDPEHGISGHVFQTGDPLLVRNIDRESTFKSSLVSEYNTKSFLSVPLTVKNEVQGVLNVADKKDSTPFDWFDLRILSTIAGQIVEAYKNLKLEAEVIQNRELKKELEIAEGIQKRTLPDPVFRRQGFSAAASICMARAVGGDLYSFSEADQNRYAVAIADVSGKGIPAALFVSTLRNSLLTLSSKRSLPREIMRRLNEVMFRDSEAGMFATSQYLLCDTSSRLILLANAGHMPALLISKAGTIRELTAAGCPLGVEKDRIYNETAVIYEDEDLLFLYTDGITEELLPDGSEFGEKRLKDFLIEHRHLEPEELNSTLMDHLHRLAGTHPEEDDQTCITIRLGSSG